MSMCCRFHSVGGNTVVLYNVLKTPSPVYVNVFQLPTVFEAVNCSVYTFDAFLSLKGSGGSSAFF